MPVQQPLDQLTPREAILMQNERESEERQIAFGIRMKELDIEAQKVESKWSALLRLPMAVIKLPMLVFLGISLVVCYIKGKEPSEHFWNILR
jgi:hypothetical protein